MPRVGKEVLKPDEDKDEEFHDAAHDALHRLAAAPQKGRAVRATTD